MAQAKGPAYIQRHRDLEKCDEHLGHFLRSVRLEGTKVGVMGKETEQGGQSWIRA